MSDGSHLTVGCVLKRQTTDVMVARRRQAAAGRRQAGCIPTKTRAPQDPEPRTRGSAGGQRVPAVGGGFEKGDPLVVDTSSD